MLNYREREKIFLALPFDFAKTGGHEVCSRIHPRLRFVSVANIRRVATAVSGKAGTAV